MGFKELSYLLVFSLNLIKVFTQDKIPLYLQLLNPALACWVLLEARRQSDLTTGEREALAHWPSCWRVSFLTTKLFKHYLLILVPQFPSNFQWMSWKAGLPSSKIGRASGVPFYAWGQWKHVSCTHLLGVVHTGITWLISQLSSHLISLYLVSGVR